MSPRIRSADSWPLSMLAASPGAGAAPVDRVTVGADRLVDLGERIAALEIIFGPLRMAGRDGPHVARRRMPGRGESGEPGGEIGGRAAPQHDHDRAGAGL